MKIIHVHNWKYIEGFRSAENIFKNSIAKKIELLGETRWVEVCKKVIWNKDSPWWKERKKRKEEGGGRKRGRKKEGEVEREVERGRSGKREKKEKREGGRGREKERGPDSNGDIRRTLTSPQCLRCKQLRLFALCVFLMAR